MSQEHVCTPLQVEADDQLDISRGSRASTTWDSKAQEIVAKLKGRMNWLRETPEMPFEVSTAIGYGVLS